MNEPAVCRRENQSPSALATSCVAVSVILFVLIAVCKLLDSAGVAFAICAAGSLTSLPLAIWFLTRRLCLPVADEGAPPIRFWFVVGGWSVYSVWLLMLADIYSRA